jgi:hypothetical protein
MLVEREGPREVRGILLGTSQVEVRKLGLCIARELDIRSRVPIHRMLARGCSTGRLINVCCRSLVHISSCSGRSDSFSHILFNLVEPFCFRHALWCGHAAGRRGLKADKATVLQTLNRLPCRLNDLLKTSQLRNASLSEIVPTSEKQQGD